MEAIAGSKVDLFAENLPGLEDIQKLSNYVNSSNHNYIEFEKKIKQQLDNVKASNALPTGVALYILGDYEKAVEILDKAKDQKEKFLFQAFSFRNMKNYENALKALDKFASNEGDKKMAVLEKAQTYRLAGDLEKAEKELDSVKNLKDKSAEYHYQIGRYQEAIGDYEKATDNYSTAIELDPNHQHAMFHLAYRCDLSGDDEAAIDYYKQISQSAPVSVNALLNLAVLYEDRGEFNNASNCVDLVLNAHPNHQRAQLFKKDIESSKTMFFDEEKERKKDRKNKILETPISDFELSVRSRNCLRKMNINTLGDLLQITEAELLSYKNFGETSLQEIKEILASKNLQLGMHKDQGKGHGKKGTSEKKYEGDLAKTVDELNLSVRARKGLQKLGIRTLGELTERTEAELLGCKNFGVTSLNEIKEALGKFDLKLRTLE